MNPASLSLTHADPQEWWYEIPATAQLTAWQQVQDVTAQRWSAYLNALCLEVLLPDWPGATLVTPAQHLPRQWELVTGSVIQVDRARLVLLPSEQMDDAELRVPQEWVDLPNWAADYYLGVQLNLEEGWLRVWGYTAHATIKQGHYDGGDRTYSVATPTRDLAALRVTQQLCPPQPLQIGAIAPLPKVQAENLLQRLGQPTLLLPRLELPFTLWGALLNQPNWAARLGAMRLGQPDPTPPVIRLSRWLQDQVETVVEDTLQGIDAAWQSLQTANLVPQTAWRGAVRAPLAMPPFEISRVKILSLGAPGTTVQVALMVGVMRLESQQVRIGIQVLPLSPEVTQGLQVCLLDGDSQVLGQMAAAPTESVQLQFSGSEGEQFRIEIQLGSHLGSSSGSAAQSEEPVEPSSCPSSMIEWFEI